MQCTPYHAARLRRRLRYKIILWRERRWFASRGRRRCGDDKSSAATDKGRCRFIVLSSIEKRTRNILLLRSEDLYVIYYNIVRRNVMRVGRHRRISRRFRLWPWPPPVRRDVFCTVLSSTLARIIFFFGRNENDFFFFFYKNERKKDVPCAVLLSKVPAHTDYSAYLYIHDNIPMIHASRLG